MNRWLQRMLLAECLSVGVSSKLLVLPGNVAVSDLLIIEEVMTCVNVKSWNLVSHKKPTMLLKMTKEDLVNFSFQQMNKELATKAPLWGKPAKKQQEVKRK